MNGVAERYRGQLLEAARHAHDAGVTDAPALAAALYDRWYAPARDEVWAPLPPPVVAAHLRAADAAGARFERGWRVLAPGAAEALIGPPRSSWPIAVARDDEARWVDPADLLYEPHVGLRPPAGASVAVAAHRDSLAQPYGWWTTFGRAWPRAAPPFVRVYWSVRAERVFALVEALTAGLDARAAWALKCPLDIERCRRPDAVVLYLPVAAWSRARHSIARVYRAARGSLATDVPALTLALAPGLGLAEDPRSESFGTARCRIVAEGMVPALADPASDHAVLARAAERALASHGISLAAPYLAPGSQVSYEWTTP
jgi:hypothetical protein